MTGLENEGFVGFDGQWVEAASPDAVPSADPVAYAAGVEWHFVLRGTVHADRLVEEMTLSMVDGRLVDLSGSVEAFSAVTVRQKQYATALCDRVADHAHELRAAVAARDAGIPVSYTGPVYAASHLSDRESRELAAGLDSVSARLSSRAGNGLPLRLRAAGWSEVSSTDLRARAARLGNLTPPGGGAPEPAAQPLPSWLPDRIGYHW
ncbi:hypothetical protein ABZ816_35630 [Actinosynnema sp. NPDC047251]|uniref:Uncharacterized protein n=1 Tax=Saccharothrix espanaensis (strain ATCC 51144 / DSM 44229 / JCM 9112 / NBRC 15066 / NRRL 15764) TaxID=1179773 RepID=K0JWZ7_SACES|nr:hypothetical protein [Saccharothrix espanaensis]CCH29304.1 hypothetical protein BN6_19830 [Saccharothrix espanaensis DSM 44229]